MKFEFFLARRYLFAKKSNNAINIISFISMMGVIIMSAAFVFTLSVFNGFHDLISSLYSNFDPEIKIEILKGKRFDSSLPEFNRIREMKDILVWEDVLEESVVINYNDRQIPARIKGVDDKFRELTSIDDIIISGKFLLNDSVVDYAIPGVGLAAQLGVNPGFIRPLEIYIPRRNAKVNMTNPTDAFNEGRLFVSGKFAVSQIKYDDSYLLAPIHFVRDMLESPGMSSAVELKLIPGANIEKIKKEISDILGPDYIVQNRYEQQKDSYRIMQVEKWITYLILSFILLIESFTVVTSLSMLIVDKKNDIDTLINLGAGKKLIKRIFMAEGSLISIFGAFFGIIIGVILVLIQSNFGIIKLGDGGGMFIVDNYPVKLMLSDIVLISIVVLIVGIAATMYPAQTIINRYYNNKNINS